MDSLDCINKEVYQLLVKNQLLENLIKKEIVNSISKKLEITEEMKSSIKNNILKNQNLKDESELNDWLAKKNTTQEQFIDLISKPQRIQEYCLDKYSHMTEARFLKRKDSLDKVTYSLIRVKDLFIAQELFLRIEENPAVFGDLAIQYSSGSEQSSRGIVGPVSLNQGHPHLVNLLKNSTPGEVNQPIKIGDFWIITRVEHLEKAVLNNETIKVLSQEIFNEWLDDKVKAKANEMNIFFSSNTNT